MRIEKATRLACDFCGRDQDEAQILIHGPRDVCICEACIAACVTVINERTPDVGRSEPTVGA